MAGITYLFQGEASAGGRVPIPDKVGAVKIGPSLIPVETYGTTLANVKEAVQKRVLDKKLPFQADAESRRLMARLVSASMHYKTGIFSEDRVRDWARNHPVMSELVSSKWAPARVTDAMRQLEAEARPLRDLVGFSIKLEALPCAGKPPRLLIADGDVGQLCALLSIHCFETLLFDAFHAHSVKHKAPDEALERALKDLRGTGNRARNLKKQTVEGDGSAWDARCSEQVRDAIEMPILWHISRLLASMAGVPREWLEKAQELNEDAHLKAPVKDVDRDIGIVMRYCKLCFPAIRRSGHRGTSCLNYWVNFCMWATAVSREPWKHLIPNTRFTRSRWDDRKVYFNWLMEGDDSLLTVAHLEEHWSRIEAHWKDWGFEMKIKVIQPGSYGTCIGWNFVVDDFGPLSDEMCPEPKRGLASSAWSTSALLRQGANPACRSRMSDWHAVAESSYAARYYHMAGRVPWLASYYRACAEWHHQEGRLLTREFQMKLYGCEVEVDVGSVIRAADLRAQVNRPCRRLMTALGLDLPNEKEAMFNALRSIGPDDAMIVRDLFPACMVE